MARDSDGRFWERLSLDEMSEQQWESLCDGCGRCCLQKLEDEDTAELWFTRVSCRQLDCDSGRCLDYENRFERVPDCLSVRPMTTQKIQWLPQTCAYRRLALGQPLENWHPLISGRAESVREAGISVAGLCVPETEVDVDDYFRHVIHWEDIDPE